MPTRPVLAPLLALLAVAQQPAAKPAPELYPPERPATHVLFFLLDGKLEAEPLRKALSELSTKDASCALVCGPRQTPARPGAQFVAVEAPASVGTKELLPALRKGCEGVSALAVTCFEGGSSTLGANAEGQGFLGMGARDFVLGMSGEVRWYDAQGGWRQFYPPRRQARREGDRRPLRESSSAPSSAATPGHVARSASTGRWPSRSTPRPPRARRRRSARLAGVTRCRLDPSARTLALELRLENLRAPGCGCPSPAPIPRARARRRRPARARTPRCVRVSTRWPCSRSWTRRSSRSRRERPRRAGSRRAFLAE